LIPRAALFISEVPFVAFVRNKTSSQQQDLPMLAFSAAA